MGMGFDVPPIIRPWDDPLKRACLARLLRLRAPVQWPNSRRTVALKECHGILPMPGGVAFKRAGDPNVGEFSDAIVLKEFGDVPEDFE
jgi:hypothetical protein